MIRFKNPNAPGFMLFEVLLALAVIGIALTPLFGLQSTMIRSIARISANVQRFLLAHDFLVQSRSAFLAHDESTIKQEKKAADPTTTLIYEAKPVDEKGPFKSLPGIMQEETDYVWPDGRTEQREIVVSFVYKPRKKKS
jgi:type II secretory pathway pseudopilin PulG